LTYPLCHEQLSLQRPAFRAAFNLPSPKDLQVCEVLHAARMLCVRMPAEAYRYHMCSTRCIHCIKQRQMCPPQRTRKCVNYCVIYCVLNVFVCVQLICCMSVVYVCACRDLTCYVIVFYMLYMRVCACVCLQRHLYKFYMCVCVCVCAC